MNRRLVAAVLVLTALIAGCSRDNKETKSPETLLKAAIAAQTKGEDDAAIGLFREVLDKQPGNVVAHYNLGVIFQKRNFIDDALREYGAALTANPKYVPALFNTATIYGNTDPALAIATYRKVISLQPKAPTAYLNLGLLELGLGQTKQGLKDLTTALRQDPTLVDRLTPAVKEQVSKANEATPSPSP